MSTRVLQIHEMSSKSRNRWIIYVLTLCLKGVFSTWRLILLEHQITWSLFCGDWGLPDIENLEVHWNQRHNGMIFTLWWLAHCNCFCVPYFYSTIHYKRYSTTCFAPRVWEEMKRSAVFKTLEGALPAKLGNDPSLGSSRNKPNRDMLETHKHHLRDLACLQLYWAVRTLRYVFLFVSIWCISISLKQPLQWFLLLCVTNVPESSDSFFITILIPSVLILELATIYAEDFNH